MSEVQNDTRAGGSAGTQLRAARSALGLSLSALAASIKVGQSKLEALEADRLDLLPDATFARALAQTVCRALKIDPQPVLAALPAGSGYRLEQLGEGINTPFRDHGDRSLGRSLSRGGSVWIWAAAAVAAATALVLLAPAAWWSTLRSERGEVAMPGESASASTSLDQTTTEASRDAPTPDEAAAASRPLAERTGVSAEVAANTPPASSATVAPVTVATASAPTSASASASGPAGAPLRLQARAESWVEVVDAQGRTLISRTLAAGEQVALDGSAPLKVKIGNALGTDLVFRGMPVDLSAKTKDNVARLELAR